MKNTVTIGRTLDGNGQPLSGTGVEINLDGQTAKLLASQSDLILFSNPVSSEFGAVVNIPAGDGQVITKGLGICPSGAAGPPEHIHPSYEEEFEVLEGAFIFSLGKRSAKVIPGEKIIVAPGIPHAFRPEGNSVSSFLVEARPVGKLNEVVHTIFGLAHDNMLDKKGEPRFWQGIAIGKELSDDTLFTSPPPAVQRFMFRLLGNTAAKKGYKGIYPEYMEDDFWKKRVEQLKIELA